MVLEGDIVVARLSQADGASKLRPVVLLRELPGFGDYLVCGISSQLRQAIFGFDIVLDERVPGFAGTGLKVASVVRLTFLAVVPVDRMTRRLGQVPSQLMETLRLTLAQHLLGQWKP